MAAPAIRYVGHEWRSPYTEETQLDARGVPTRVRTLDGPSLARAVEGDGDELQERPPFAIMQATIGPGGSWVAPAAAEHTALCYVRRGAVRINNQLLGAVPAGSTVSFRRDGSSACVARPRSAHRPRRRSRRP